MSDEHKNYQSGDMGNPFAPGAGQIGYQQHQAREKAKLDKLKVSTKPRSNNQKSQSPKERFKNRGQSSGETSDLGERFIGLIGLVVALVIGLIIAYFYGVSLPNLFEASKIGLAIVAFLAIFAFWRELLSLAIFLVILYVVFFKMIPSWFG